MSARGLVRHQPLQPRKGAKLIQTTSRAAPTANVTTDVFFDSAAYNYGGFTFGTGSGLLKTIIVPEKGLYRIEALLGCIANTQSILQQPNVNATAALPDGVQGGIYVGATASNGAYLVLLPSTIPVELAKGDAVGMFYTQATGPQASVAGFTWLAVTRLEEPLS